MWKRPHIKHIYQAKPVLHPGGNAVVDMAVGDAIGNGTFLGRWHSIVSQPFSQHRSISLVALAKVVDGSLLQEALGIAQMGSNVVNQPLSFVLLQGLTEKYSALGKVVLICGIVLLNFLILYLDWESGSLFVFLWSLERVWEIVWNAGVVSINVHGSVPLVAHHPGTVRTIDGDLLEVGSQPMAVSVVVGKQSTLQHFVWASLDSGH